MPYDGYPEHRARSRSGRAQPDRYRPATEKEGRMTHGNQSTSGGQQALSCKQSGRDQAACTQRPQGRAAGDRPAVR